MTETLRADALDLARILRPGDHIVWGQACGEPTTLVEALIAQRAGLGGVSAFAGTSFSGLLTPDIADHVAISSMGAIGALRTLARAGVLGIVPCHVGQIAALIEGGIIGCDVAFVQVSPANADGNHSYGLINDYVQAAVARARVVVAEVNDQVPFTACDALLPRARIDYLVEVSRPPVEVKPAPIGAEDLAIATHAAAYIGDGSVIQIGIGAVPDAITRLIGDRRDLGVHSGMIGDGLVDLVEAGVVTNALKPFETGISVTGALIGTRRLYDFADRNPAVGLRSSALTHADAVLTAIPRLVTINSAVEVDLTGQVNAEQTGASYIGGTGGQVDYVRAGARSPGGRSIIALPATAAGGKASRIVPALSGPVTTARSEADVIVTEYGAAELKGRTLAERARRLVAIAHPDFREELDRAAFEIARRGY
ncbi:acetyl-CoA hydrolase/transferase [Sphingomonas sp. MM-1]|uniref:acetyl-CoA hydrolase/transferase family protein n=1 Tax=Sphingomonas sp. MM-1 TaxID=745310 RepID=UPI0002C13911|nr:acetyl-CoA hydrolase/transferase C-terminal domain-containing protein [Sphingomonas sp. MM-1]AGH48989.1 acetyl-CoA hydrolase/transferase [Sphingomonas sp. MM-1]